MEIWKYCKRYLHFAILAALCMVGEVMMDLLQSFVMSAIVDDGVLSIHNGGVGNMSLIWTLGGQMICLVLFGGLCGNLNQGDQRYHPGSEFRVLVCPGHDPYIHADVWQHLFYVSSECSVRKDRAVRISDDCRH